MDVFGVELTAAALVVVVLAAWLGGVAQSSIGFGAAFTTVPALAVVAPELLPGSMLVAILPMSLVMVVLDRGGIDLAGVVRLTLGRLPGIVAGAIVVATLAPRMLTGVIAVVLLAAVAASSGGWQLEVTANREVAAGFLSGLTGTAAALGGPPLALLYRGRSGTTLRPTLAAVWAVGLVPALGSLTIAGEFTVQQAQAGGLLAVVLLLGLVTGTVLVRTVRDERIRQWVLWWAGLGGLLALVRAVLG